MAGKSVLKSTISRDTRLMLIAPHPDDEALACGILLQRAVRAGAAIRVLYATDGENNPWPQRALERKWRLHSRDRQRWGRLRRNEARASLSVLGLGQSQAQFFGLPDQGLAKLLMHGCQSTLALFKNAISAWKPTLLLIPSISDPHPDHNAIGVMLRVIHRSLLEDLSNLSVWSYQVHGRNATISHSVVTLSQSRNETATKSSAIKCHKTQLSLSRRRFLAYAKRPEKFRILTAGETAVGNGVVRSSVRDAHTLQFYHRFPFHPFSGGERRVVLLGQHNSFNRVCCLTAILPNRSCDVEAIDQHTGRCATMMAYRGNAFAGTATIATTMFSSATPVFLQVDRGDLLSRNSWLEINPVTLVPPDSEIGAAREREPLQTVSSG